MQNKEKEINYIKLGSCYLTKRRKEK